MPSYSEHQEWISNIFGQRNRSRRHADLVADMLRHAGRLSKPIRLAKCSKPCVLDQRDALRLASIAGRVMTLDAGMDLDVWGAFCRKYPGYCTYCTSTQCQCHLPISWRDKSLHRESQSTSRLSFNGTLSTHQNALHQVYRFVNDDAGLYRVMLHVMEEIAEVSDALYRQQIDNLAVELADVLAHTMSLASMLDLDLDHLLTQRYGDGCPKCRQSRCVCTVMRERS